MTSVKHQVDQTQNSLTVPSFMQIAFTFSCHGSKLLQDKASAL
jgi:hypothetical protein